MFDLFRAFVVVHIVCGSVGLASFWGPVLGRKGGPLHRRTGRLFTYAMLLTGSAAVGISICTLIAPMVCHPKLVGRFDAPFVRGIFGWMMLYLAILTINLAWYGWLCVRNQRHHARNREWRNLALQALVLLAAANCAWQGLRIGQPLMGGIAIVGIAAGVTNLWFIYERRPAATRWQHEHIKALIGAGISVYTAFCAFGAVRILPALALNPVLWGVPLVTGLALILYHQRAVSRRYAASRRSTAPAA